MHFISNTFTLIRVNKIFLFIVTSLSCVFASTAQLSHSLIEARSYSIGQGLSQKMIQNMVQDDDHFIWIATWNGLEKFDGYSFRNFKTYPTDSVRMQHNRIVSVAAGPRNGLWCETFDSRLYIFDKGRERFIDPFTLHPGIKPCESVKQSFFLQGGVLWVSARDGSLWRFEGERYDGNGALKYFQPTRPERGETIYGIYSDNDGGEWVLSNHGYWVYGKPDISGLREFVLASGIAGGLLLIDSEGKMAVYASGSGDVRDVAPGVFARTDTKPFTLNDGRVVIGLDGGVGLFDPARGSVRAVGLPSDGVLTQFYEQTGVGGRANVLWMFSGADVLRLDMATMDCRKLDIPYSDSTESLGMQFIHEDGNGEMWIYPLNGHLCHYNASSGDLERARILTDRGDDYTPDISSCMIDDRRNIWGRTPLGIQKFSFSVGRSATMVGAPAEYRGLLIDSRGNLWASCKEKAIALFDSDYNYMGNLSPSGDLVKDHNLKFGASVYTIMEDSKGRIWLGSKGDGIYVATPELTSTDGLMRCKIKHYTKSLTDMSSLGDPNVYSIFEDRRGRIWVGTYGGGLNLVDEGKFGAIRFIHARNGGLPTYPIVSCDKVRYVTSNSNGDIMLCTTGGFVTFDDDFASSHDIRFYRNWSDITRDSTLSNNDVFFAYEDSRHDIYLTTMAGRVCRLEGNDILRGNLKFSYINKRNGLPSDMAYSIHEDKDGYLWIAFETALCRYDPRDRSIVNYDRYDFHLPLVSTEVPFVVDSDGKATLALINGLLNVDLTALKKSDYVPVVHFYDGEVSTDDGRMEQIPVSEDGLELGPDRRNITITFAALDYGNTENISYMYRLRGLNDHWIDNGHSNRASFYSLPAGDYVLEVRSTNCEGAWNDHVYSLPIHVEPTFVETVWAKLLYIFAFLIIGLAVWYVSVYILRLQRRIDIEQELTRLKLRFFTDVSHELRTPLTLIVNPVDEVLADESLSQSSRDYMTMVKSNTDRMLRLINQFLDIRKIQNSKMKVCLERIDIVPLFHRIHRDFSGLARQKEITLSMSCPMEECRVYTDVDKFEKILFNLLSNAFKYTPEGKCVSFGLSMDGNNLMINVMDEGEGIDECQKSRMFARFETLGRRSKAPSSGIGLSLVKEIVAILHGSISVSSEIGRGSVFSVTLPVDYESFCNDSNVELMLNDGNPGDRQCAAVTDKMTVIGSDRNVSDFRILVVEDNDDLRRMLCRMLGDSYNVTEAVDGQDALEKITVSPPDMIISDIMMPRMDGLELLGRMRSDSANSHIPFVLLSAKASVSERIEGLECGADDYLTKPFSSSYLKARIRSLIRQRTRLLDCLVTGDPVAKAADRVAEGDELPVLTGYDTEFVSRLSAYIERESSRSELTIDEMASAMNLGRTVFNRKVKSLFNATPVELLTAVRLKRAAALLGETGLTVAEVSYRCGFTSPQYFNRVFKSRYGRTPSEWRANPVDAPSAGGQKV